MYFFTRQFAFKRFQGSVTQKNTKEGDCEISASSINNMERLLKQPETIFSNTWFLINKHQRMLHKKEIFLIATISKGYSCLFSCIFFPNCVKRIWKLDTSANKQKYCKMKIKSISTEFWKKRFSNTFTVYFDHVTDQAHIEHSLKDVSWM